MSLQTFPIINNVKNYENEVMNIEILDYSSLNLKYFPRNHFNNYNNLKHLNLSNNLIKNINNCMFSSLKNLKILNLSNNFIKNININDFSYLSNIKELDLSYNFVKKINNYTFSHLSYLKILNLNNNRISFIDKFAFHNLNKMKYLSIQNNSKEIYIHENNYNYFHNIKHLYLSISVINKINYLKNVELLSVNYIKDINIFNLNKLYSISITNTSIKKIFKNTFYSLSNLHYLHISHNSELKEIESDFINNCTNISLIFINYNPKLYILKHQFNLNNIKSLHLNNNNLIFIQPNICLKCHRLQELYLQYNYLDVFEINIPKMLNTLYLNNNKINKVKIKKNNLKLLNLQNNFITQLNIYKNNIPTINISNNLLLKNNYDKDYLFLHNYQILYIFNSISTPIFYHSCFEVYNNINKFNSLKINIEEVYYIINICNFPEILKQYFYKLYLLTFIPIIENKKKLKMYYFKSIKNLEIILNIHYSHKYIFHKIHDTYTRNYILQFI